MSRSKKHHYIPQFILRNFSDSRGKLLVKRHGQDDWRQGTPNTVGYRNNAHSVSAWLHDDPSFYEARMSTMESESAPLIRALAAGEYSTVPEEMRDTLQRFILMNLMREPGLLERIVPEVLAEQDAQLMQLPDANRLIHDLGIAALAWPIPGSEHDPAIRSYPGRDDAYADVFAEFKWNVVRFSDDTLVLGDRLVCTYGLSKPSTGEVSLRDSHFGAAGLAFSDRVTVPLSPRFGLLLSRAGRPETLTSVAFNRATVLNSQSFVIHHPTWRSSAGTTVSHAVDAHIGEVEARFGLRRR